MWELSNIFLQLNFSLGTHIPLVMRNKLRLRKNPFCDLYLLSGRVKIHLVFRKLWGLKPWGRKWQPTPAFLPGKSHGQRSPVGYSPWGLKELDMTERLSTQRHQRGI